MSEELQQKLRTQLWTVANTLRGNMSASDFMYGSSDISSDAMSFLGSISRRGASA